MGEAHAADAHAADYIEVPGSLAKAHPALFEHPRQIDRLRVYSIAYDVADLLAAPPSGPLRHLPELHAYRRLERVVEGKSYLDVLGRQLDDDPD